MCRSAITLVCLFVCSVPPPQVSFLGCLTNTREMVQVFVGAFYGLPLFPAEQAPPLHHLLSLEDWMLTRYYHHRDSLTAALLSFAAAATQKGGASFSHTPSSSSSSVQLFEEQVNAEYQQCFKMQASLARLRNFIRAESESESMRGGVFRLHDDGGGRDPAHFSVSMLIKMVGCLVDTLLALSVGNNTSDSSATAAIAPTTAATVTTTPTTVAGGATTCEGGVSSPEFPLVDAFSGHVCLLSEEECRVLFYTLCIHGIPKMHARAIALLIKFCGSQRWWGHFVVSVVGDLFSEHQAAVFNKER